MAKEEQSLLDKIQDVSYRRGIAFPAAEIYGGLSGVFEYGPIGTLMRRKIINFWREYFVKSENHYEIEGAIILPEKVFEGSGHLAKFCDPLIQCKNCKSMYRADKVIEESLKQNVDGLLADELDKIIAKNKLTCPRCKGEFMNAREFNLMLKTEIGSTEGIIAYLRPETAQNIFTSFKRIAHTMRAQLPFGIAQVGKVYRNEISPRQFIIRVREFTQMELEVFFAEDQLDNPPNFEEVADELLPILTREQQAKNIEKPLEVTAEEAAKKKVLPNAAMAYYLAKEKIFFEEVGVNPDLIRFRHMLPKETPHYSGGNFDLEVKLSIGWTEVVGNAFRQQHDLKSHEGFSGTKMATQYGNDNIIPYVIEPSIGVGRTLYCILESCYRETEDREWTWFQFPPTVSPYDVQVCPLMKKDGLEERALEIFEDLKAEGMEVIFDSSGKIGKRYARADEIGIPYSVTIDYDTLNDDTVTIRDRDTMEQIRIACEDLADVLVLLLSEEYAFNEIEKVLKELEENEE
ncbi:MAG: glycine--tRNA ligase [Candidatus Heimdallarchaeota archaeon]|nr:glycine--tRNA ligase [Candidatus Heimdallarchaeota archaeon]